MWSVSFYVLLKTSLNCKNQVMTRLTIEWQILKHSSLKFDIYWQWTQTWSTHYPILLPLCTDMIRFMVDLLDTISFTTFNFINTWTSFHIKERIKKGSLRRNVWQNKLDKYTFEIVSSPNLAFTLFKIIACLVNYTTLSKGAIMLKFTFWNSKLCLKFVTSNFNIQYLLRSELCLKTIKNNNTFYRSNKSRNLF